MTSHGRAISAAVVYLSQSLPRSTIIGTERIGRTVRIDDKGRIASRRVQNDGYTTGSFHDDESWHPSAFSSPALYSDFFNDVFVFRVFVVDIMYSILSLLQFFI
jgi:hypothetical protein